MSSPVMLVLACEQSKAMRLATSAALVRPVAAAAVACCRTSGGSCRSREPRTRRERHAGRRHGNQHLQAILVEAAWAAVRHPGYLRRSTTGTSGKAAAPAAIAKKKAITVVAHAITVIIWHALATGRPYDERAT